MSKSEDWIKQALCKDKTELFFPTEEDAKRAFIFYKQAKAICAECPVSEQCLQYALDEQLFFGVWGGKSPNERRELYKKHIYFTK